MMHESHGPARMLGHVRLSEHFNMHSMILDNANRARYEFKATWSVNESITIKRMSIMADKLTITKTALVIQKKRLSLISGCTSHH